MKTLLRFFSLQSLLSFIALFFVGVTFHFIFQLLSLLF